MCPFILIISVALCLAVRYAEKHDCEFALLDNTQSYVSDLVRSFSEGATRNDKLYKTTSG